MGGLNMQVIEQVNPHSQDKVIESIINLVKVE